MAKLLIAAATDPDMRYASGLPVIDPFILVDTGRRRHLLLSALEYGWAKRALGRRQGYEVVLLDPLYQEVKRRLRKRRGRKVRKGSLLAGVAALYLAKLRIGKVTVSPRMEVGHVEQLRKAGVKVAVSPRPLYPGRAVKTRKEVAEIRKVRDATVAALRRCIGIIRRSTKGKGGVLMHGGKPVTAERLRMEARQVLLAHACEAQELIVSHGPQTAYAHDFGSGPIRWGEPVILDIFPRSMESGYWFDMTRTVCKGMPSPELKRLYVTVKKAQAAALATVRAGVTAGAVHKAAADVFEEAGYVTSDEEGYIHSTGHGVGLEIHEAPSLHAGNPKRLKAGMVLTVEPGLYYRALGGVRIEDTVMVTTTGYKDLTRMPKALR